MSEKAVPMPTEADLTRADNDALIQEIKRARDRIVELEGALTGLIMACEVGDVYAEDKSDRPEMSAAREAAYTIGSVTYEPYTTGLDIEQPAPTPNDQPAVWDLVLADMHARDAVGRERYGTPLQPHNGRDALKDAYAEALDLCVYLRQTIFERDGN